MKVIMNDLSVRYVCEYCGEVCKYYQTLLSHEKKCLDRKYGTIKSKTERFK